MYISASLQPDPVDSLTLYSNACGAIAYCYMSMYKILIRAPFQPDPVDSLTLYTSACDHGRSYSILLHSYVQNNHSYKVIIVCL